MTKRAEGSFGSLRYLFGGDHPSQTTHQSMSPFHGLESKQMKGRISTAAPRILAYPLQSLRPILHITCPDSMISYSKGSRGLFVPSRVIGIFTDTTISLSSRLRQRPDHYTIRAGRNLPDKEFRYLRTVIVTAAVYRDFDQELSPHHLIFRHRAGITPYTSTFVFAECCVFSKQLQPPILCDLFMLGVFHSSHYKGTPYPEVTVSICRVPSPEFSQAPEYIQLAHLCRFTVRSTSSYSLEAFPGSSSHHFTAKCSSMLCLGDSPADLPAGLLHAQTGTSNTRMMLKTPSPLRT